MSDTQDKKIMRPVKVKEEEVKEGENIVDKQLMEMMDEFEEPSVSSYAKFKT